MIMIMMMMIMMMIIMMIIMMMMMKMMMMVMIMMMMMIMMMITMTMITTTMMIYVIRSPSGSLVVVRHPNFAMISSTPWSPKRRNSVAARCCWSHLKDKQR